MIAIKAMQTQFSPFQDNVPDTITWGRYWYKDIVQSNEHIFILF